MQEGQAKRARMQQAASHFLNQRLAICFLTWRAALEKALLGAAKLDHAVGHWLHGTQAKVFTVWRDRARFKAKSRPVLAGMPLVCVELSRAWSLWGRPCCMALWPRFSLSGGTGPASKPNPGRSLLVCFFVCFVLYQMPSLCGADHAAVHFG